MAKVFTGNVAINQTIAMSIRTTFHSENKRNNNNKLTDKRVIFSSYHRRRVHYSATFFTLQPKWIVSALPGGKLHLLHTVHRQSTPSQCLAPGIDRISMLLADEPNIREVIALPADAKRAEPVDRRSRHGIATTIGRIEYPIQAGGLRSFEIIQILRREICGPAPQQKDHSMQTGSFCCGQKR